MSKGNCNDKVRNQAAPDGYVECPLVFISVPWDEEKGEYPAWLRGACIKALNEGRLPVVPYGMYSSMIGEDIPHGSFLVTSLVLTLLSACREFWMFEDESGILSENQAQELMRAMDFNKPIRHFYMKEDSVE